MSDAHRFVYVTDRPMVLVPAQDEDDALEEAVAEREAIQWESSQAAPPREHLGSIGRTYPG